MLGMKTGDVLDCEIESSPKLLAAIDKEIKKVTDESDKVSSTIARLESEAGDLEGAKQEADTAQAELDEIEASTLLGDDDEAARRKAVAALTKARNKSQKAQEEASRREAAARGLRRKHEELIARLDALTQKHAAVAQFVHRDEIEQAEKRLIDLLEGDELAEIMQSLNTAVRSYGKAQKTLNGFSQRHDTRKLKVELPDLIAHPDRKGLTGRDATGVLTI